MSGSRAATSALMMLCSLLSTTTNVDAFPGGAPSRACSSMMPSHLNHQQQPQTVPAPYTLTVSPTGTGYGSQQQFDVTLSAVGNATFKGFLIFAKATAGSDAGQPVGTWVSVQRRNGLKLECDRKAVTQAFNRVRSTITAIWKSPSRSAGPVVFTATVVESFSTFWLNVESEPLAPAA